MTGLKQDYNLQRICIEMHNSRLGLIKFGFVLFLICSEAQDVVGSGHFCLRSSPAEDGQTRVTFLREDAAGARSLYLSLWSGARLVTCEVNVNPLVTRRYSTVCDRSRPDVAQRFINISMLFAPDAPCAPSSGAPKVTRRTRRGGREEGKRRRKRAWIFPGTLWCGTGSTAEAYDQLGMFESADRCCREHDHCPHIIPAFTEKYGVFNLYFFTVSHCDCDQRFQRCLLGVNDTISNTVGYSFFNILRAPCFELKQQKRCTEMYWWGMCKVAKDALYAVFKNSLSYNTADVTSKYEDSKTPTSSERQHVTESPEIILHRKSPKCEHRCRSRNPPRGDVFYDQRTKGKECRRCRKLSAVSQRSSMDPGLRNAPKSSILISDMKRDRKKKRRGLKAYSKIQETTNSYPRTISTQSNPALTLQTPITNKAIKSHKKVPK